MIGHITRYGETTMGRMIFLIKDELEKKLRDKLNEKSTGRKKGDISRAVNQAIKLWLDIEEDVNFIPTEDLPFEEEMEEDENE